MIPNGTAMVQVLSPYVRLYFVQNRFSSPQFIIVLPIYRIIENTLSLKSFSSEVLKELLLPLRDTRDPPPVDLGVLVVVLDVARVTDGGHDGRLQPPQVHVALPVHVLEPTVTFHVL